MLLTPDQARRAYTHAADNGYAILAVNADSPAAVRDALDAAAACAAPIIIETSLWQLTGRSYGAGDARLGLARYLTELALLADDPAYAPVPVLFHTDHIKGPVTRELLTSAAAGIELRLAGQALTLRPSSISLDSSELDESENIALLTAIAAAADAAGAAVTLEMEAGVDDGVTALDVTERLVAALEAAAPSKLALWAPGVGTVHGFSDTGFPSFSPAAIAAHQQRASELCGRTIGLALHGSSGLDDDALRAAVANGVAKVNWSSESLLIRSQGARAYYAEHGDQLERGQPRFKTTAMDTGLQTFVGERYRPAVEARIRLLGGAGQATAILSPEACHVSA